MPSSFARELLTALFLATLIVSNIIAAKVGDFSLAALHLNELFLPVAVLVFPVSYIIGDVLTEVYGYATMRRVIWLGFLANLLVVGAIYLGGLIPSAPFFTGGEAYAQILGATPRILAASFAAYLVGEFVNAYVLAKLKIKTAGRHLWLRTIGSTLIGEGLDSTVFITLAFYGSGIIPNAALPTMILTQWLFKVGFEILATPITYLVVGYLKKRDGVDAYDRETRFSPFAA